MYVQAVDSIYKLNSTSSSITLNNSDWVALGIYSAAKIKSLTDWKHTIGLNEGLKQTIEWFRNPENSKNYKADIYNV